MSNLDPNSLGGLAEAYGESGPWQQIDPERYPILAERAARAVHARRRLASVAVPVAPNRTLPGDVTAALVVDIEEWEFIRPLFELYCELENANLMSTAALANVDVTGRLPGEIALAIKDYEEGLGFLTFEELPRTVMAGTYIDDRTRLVPDPAVPGVTLP